MGGLEKRSTIRPHDNLERSVLHPELYVAPARTDGGGGGGGAGQGAIELGYILSRAAEMVKDLGCELLQERLRHVAAEELEGEIKRLTGHVCAIL
jgi:hypothetical protein